jgi:hypothetical protein
LGGVLTPDARVRGEETGGMEVVRRMTVNVTSYCTAPLGSAARPTTNWSPDRVLRLHCAKTQQKKPAGLSSRAMKPLSGSVRLTFTSFIGGASS